MYNLCVVEYSHFKTVVWCLDKCKDSLVTNTPMKLLTISITPKGSLLHLYSQALPLIVPGSHWYFCWFPLKTWKWHVFLNGSFQQRNALSYVRVIAGWGGMLCYFIFLKRTPSNGYTEVWFSISCFNEIKNKTHNSIYIQVFGTMHLFLLD